MSPLKQELTELYHECGSQLFHTALAVTTSSDLAEDAVHDAFMKAFRVTTTPENLRAYMLRAVRNAAIDIVRRQARVKQPTSDDFFEPPDDTQKATETPHDLELVTEALNSLQENQRETVVQHLVAGLSFREIAELRGRPMGTIVTWYRRAIEKLRREVNRSDD